MWEFIIGIGIGLMGLWNVGLDLGCLVLAGFGFLGFLVDLVDFFFRYMFRNIFG